MISVLNAEHQGDDGTKQPVAIFTLQQTSSLVAKNEIHRAFRRSKNCVSLTTLCTEDLRLLRNGVESQVPDDFTPSQSGCVLHANIHTDAVC